MPLATIADLNGPQEERTRLVELASSLSVMYDDFLENFPGDSHVRHPGIHASEINKCVRQSFYHLTEIEKKESVSIQWRRRFERGHAVHDMLQKHFYRMAAVSRAQELAHANGWIFTFDKEVRVSPEIQPIAAKYHIYSSCDGVFTFYANNSSAPFLRVGLEIKTESPDAYEKLNAPREEHVAQAHLYMGVLDLPLVWFFYFNKGNQNNTPSRSPWMVQFNPQAWEKLEGRMQLAINSALANVAPPREESTSCQFCPWSWTCQPTVLKKNLPKQTLRRPTP